MSELVNLPKEYKVWIQPSWNKYTNSYARFFQVYVTGYIANIIRKRAAENQNENTQKKYHLEVTRDGTEHPQVQVMIDYKTSEQVKDLVVYGKIMPVQEVF